jgi:hypothetical protein
MPLRDEGRVARDQLETIPASVFRVGWEFCGFERCVVMNRVAMRPGLI